LAGHGRKVATTGVSLTHAAATLVAAMPYATPPWDLERLKRRDRRRRIARALVLVALAVAAPFVAAADPGATIGAVVASLLLCALAVAVWPYRWSAAEERHRELEAIWRELRTDADTSVPWERLAAWAQAAGDEVELVIITCAPGEPRAYGRHVVRRVGGDDVAAAAEAMEELRADAAQRELDAQRRHEQGELEAQWRAEERALHDVDKAAAIELRAREEQLKRELAEQDAAERRAQAEAVARALRRP
jgi:hypothetical protein